MWVRNNHDELFNLDVIYKVHRQGLRIAGMYAATPILLMECKNESDASLVIDGIFDHLDCDIYDLQDALTSKEEKQTRESTE